MGTWWEASIKFIEWKIVLVNLRIKTWVWIISHIFVKAVADLMMVARSKGWRRRSVQQLGARELFVVFIVVEVEGIWIKVFVSSKQTSVATVNSHVPI
jgi:hypothetical protein